MENKKLLNDAELIALAALANAETVIMNGDNQQRAIEGWLPMWREGTGYMKYTSILMDEMERRINEDKKS